MTARNATRAQIAEQIIIAITSFFTSFATADDVRGRVLSSSVKIMDKIPKKFVISIYNYLKNVIINMNKD